MRPMVEKIQRKLDESEIQELETQITNDWRELQGAKEDKKASMKSFKEQIDGIESRMNKNSLAVKTGELGEDTDCFVEFDHDAGKAYIYLNESDTEPHHERLMTSKEMKEPLDIPM